MLFYRSLSLSLARTFFLFRRYFLSEHHDE